MMTIIDQKSTKPCTCKLVVIIKCNIKRAASKRALNMIVDNSWLAFHRGHG